MNDPVCIENLPHLILYIRWGKRMKQENRLLNKTNIQKNDSELVSLTSENHVYSRGIRKQKKPEIS